MKKKKQQKRRPVHIRAGNELALCGANPTGEPFTDSDPGCHPCMTEATRLLNEALEAFGQVEVRTRVNPYSLRPGDLVEAVEVIVVDKVRKKKGLVQAESSLTYDFESYDFYRIGGGS